MQAFASGLISAVAHSPKIAIRSWSGSASFAPGTLAGARLRVVIRTSSLEVLDEMRDSDRQNLQRVMYEEVLETGRYPEVVFESTHINAENLREALYRVNVEGRLALHGQTNLQALVCQVAFGVDSLRAHGQFTLLQTDYGIRVASIAGGSLKLQNELKFTFYVVGRKSAATAAS